MGAISGEGLCIVMGADHDEVEVSGQGRAVLCMASRLTKVMSDGRQPLQRSHDLH